MYHALQQTIQKVVLPSVQASTTTNTTPAAVLLPLIERDNGLNILLTRRSQHLRHHAGQVCFPGGKHDQHLDIDLVETALREAEEEINLQRDYIDVIGFLPPYTTTTGFNITCVVGFVRPGFKLCAAQVEVADIFEVPLTFILEQNSFGQEESEYQGRLRRYHVLKYHNYEIWGATAALLHDFAQRLRHAQNAEQVCVM